MAQILARVCAHDDAACPAATAATKGLQPRRGHGTASGMQLQELCEIGPYQVLHAPGDGAELTLSFASVGADASRLPAPEFVGTATGRGTAAFPRPALFIQDRSRSWGNDHHFEPMLRQALDRLPPPARMVTIGMSMGAFTALAAATLLPVRAVLAFVPQWSILPEVMPQETRWQEWAVTLPGLRWPTCPLPPVDGGTHCTLFHAAGDDLDHARRFPRPRNCDHILFGDQRHSGLVPALRARGVLAGLLQSAFQGDRRRLLRIAASAGGKRMMAEAGRNAGI